MSTMLALVIALVLHGGPGRKPRPPDNAQPLNVWRSARDVPDWARASIPRDFDFERLELAVTGFLPAGAVTAELHELQPPESIRHERGAIVIDVPAQGCHGATWPEHFNAAERAPAVSIVRVWKLPRRREAVFLRMESCPPLP